MLDANLAREQYRLELQRKNALMSAANLPVAILSGLGGLAALLVERFADASWTRLPFALALTGAAVAYAVSVAMLARAYIGASSAFVPRLGEMEAFLAHLEQFYVRLGYPPEQAKPDFQEQLTRWHIDATDRNAASNDRMENHLARAGQGLIGVLIGLALCGILYVSEALRAL